MWSNLNILRRFLISFFNTFSPMCACLCVYLCMCTHKYMCEHICLYKYIDKNICHSFHRYIVSHDIMQWTEGIRRAAEELQELQFLYYWSFQSAPVLPTWSLGRRDIAMWGCPFFCSDWTCSVLWRYFLFPICLIHYSRFLLHCVISHSFTIFSKTVSLYLNSPFLLLCQLLAEEG